MRFADLLIVVTTLSCGCTSTPPEQGTSRYTELRVVSGDRIRIAQPRLEEPQRIEVVLFRDDGDRVPQPAEVLAEQTLELSGGMGSFTIGPFKCLRTPVDDLWIQLTRTTPGSGREIYTSRIFWPTD